jgi:hypothetical protein
VPFIRYARDKRGYESTFVMHAYRPGQGPQRARVLYLFRTPAHVKVGRRALEPEVMEALEHTHPDLSFDWTNLPQERPIETPDPRERDARDYRRERQMARGRSSGHQGQGQRPAPRPAAPPTPPVLEDESALGRVVGAERAAHLRARYSELVLRIGRRSRTPEDRDRLMDRVHRLNPEDWADEAAVRSVVFTVEVEWESIAAELPSRRRGRRGGRHRHEGAAGQGNGPESPSADGSGIIEDAGDIQQEAGHDEAHIALDADDGFAPRGSDDPFGTGDGAGSGEADDTGAAAAESDRLPSDD